MEPEICTKMIKKVECKTQSKISCHCTWLLHGKNCPSRWRFLRSFLTARKPSRRSIPAAQRKKTRKRKSEKGIKTKGSCKLRVDAGGED